MSNGDDRRELDLYNAGLERRKRLEKEIRDAKKNESTVSDEEKRILQETLEILERSLAGQEKAGIVQQQRVQAAIDLRKAYKELDPTFENQQLVAQQTLQVMKDQQAAAEWRVKNDLGMTKVERQRQIDRAKALEKEIVRQELLIDRQNKYTVSLRDSVKSAQELGNSFGDTIAVYERSKTFNVANMIKWTQALRGGTTSIGELFRKGIAAGITGFIDTLISLMIKMNETETAFQRTTGASADFAREMTEGYERTRENTVTIEQNQQAWTALRMTMTDFTMISKSARKEIGDTVATLNNLGVSAETSVKAMQSAAVALNLGATAAGKAVIELEGYARELGVAPTQLIEQYGTMAGSLAKLGQNGTRAFKDLARVSKITGIEMQKLLTMTDKFDTFEGAAEQAGKLNAALGTNAVNAMDLLMETDPAARFEQIRGSIEDAGLSFDTMTYYQRKFFAETLGLKDAGELAAVMRGDMGSLGGEIGRTAQDYEEMASRAKDVASIKEKVLALLMRMIPVFMPLIDSLDKIITQWLDNKSAIKEFQDSIAEMMPTAKEIIDGLKKLGGMIQFVTENWEIIALMWVASATGVLPLLAKGLVAVIGKIGGFVFATKGVPPTVAPASASLGTFALSVLGIGVGIGIAAAGIGYLLSSFQDLSNVSWNNIFKGLAATALAIGLVAGALALMGNPLSAAGAGIIAGLGIGLGAAAGGIGLLIGAFKEDKTEMEDLSGVMGSFGSVSEEQFAAANVAFANMAQTINAMNAPNLKALATTAAVLPTIATTQAVAAAGGRGGTGGRGGAGAAGAPQKVNVNIEFNEDAARWLVADVVDDNARAFLSGHGPNTSPRPSSN